MIQLNDAHSETISIKAHYLLIETLQGNSRHTLYSLYEQMASDSITRLIQCNNASIKKIFL